MSNMEVVLTVGIVVLYLLGMVVMDRHIPNIEVRLDEVAMRPLTLYEKSKLILGWPTIALADLAVQVWGNDDEN